MRLLLDQMYTPQIAEQLRKRGHDVISADEPQLRGERDRAIFRAAISERRAIVTNDVGHFVTLARHEYGHFGLILSDDRSMPRSSETVGLYVRRLDKLLKDRPADGALAGLIIDGREVRAQRIVLSAGAGNAELLARLDIQQPAQQLRPLHMVLAKGPALKPLYAHCLGGGPKPRVTVTTHPAADGQWVWYLGGDLAEAEGVARDAAGQIRAAQKELADLLPWVDQSATQWATLRVSRAEPAQSGLLRPDNAFLAEQGRLLVGWPTKLALAPDFADRVLAALQKDGITPGQHSAFPALPRPALARAPWDELLP